MNWSSTRFETTRKRADRSGRVRCGALIIAAMALAAGSAGPALATKFMPTGDSITEGQGSTSGLGFRDLLYTSLNTIGTYDFVGTVGTPPYEGYYFGGARIDEFRAGGTHDVAGIMNTEQPDIVALHTGTNDVNSQPGPYGPWSNDHSNPNSNASGKLGALVKYLLEWHNGGNGTALDRVVLSRVIPIQGRESDIASFNREVVKIVLDFRNGAVTGSPEPVYLADHYRRFISNPDVYGNLMSDNLHPNDAGYQEMESIYFETVNEATNDVTPPNPVNDLAIGTVSGETVLLIWTNTGDNGASGKPYYADCRYRNGAITDDNNPSTGFRYQSMGGDYDAVGNGGEVTGERLSNLNPSTNYTFAMKLMDDAANLSGMSNTVTAGTVAGADVWADAFSRNVLGPDWSAADFIANGSELQNTAGGFAQAIFTGLVNVSSCQFDWAASATPAGIDQAGLAVRMDGSNAATSDGYMIYHNVEAGQPVVLKELIDGIPSQTIDTAPSSPAPQPGDEFKVVLSTDVTGHHFVVFVNGVPRATLDDPQKRHGNGTYYCGVIGDGTLPMNIDNWQVQTVTTNVPPDAFTLSTPGDGSIMPNLNPLLDWQNATDPNGDPVTYDLFLSTSPTFPANQTTITSGLTESFYAYGTPIAANQTFYWKVKAMDPQGAYTFSTDTWSFLTENYQQLLDDFEDNDLGPDWNADPTYTVVNGELDCIAPDFSDLAIYNVAQSPVAVEWKWSETTDYPSMGAAGCLIGLDSTDPTAANGYFVFRNTSGQQKWSVWEVQGGELVGSLNIDMSGRNPIPNPGDVIRVVFVRQSNRHLFQCYINGIYDAQLTDTQRRQGTAPITYAGMLLGNDAENNVEDFIVMAANVNLPPAPFSLLEPTNQTVLFELAPTMRWQPAIDPNPGDIVYYSIIYDTDPAFPTPDTLAAVTTTETTFIGSLSFGQMYYWKVMARDAGGEEVISNETWSFTMAQILTTVDNFNRSNLGSNWSGDTSVMRIVTSELKNTSSSSTFDMVMYNRVTTVDAVQFTWSPNANAEGIRRGGLTVMMNGTTGSASGYLVMIDPVVNQGKLEEIRNGGAGFPIASVAGATSPTGPGKRFRCAISSDASGHHFDLFVNDVFHSRVTDGSKRQGNIANWYVGVGLRGQNLNNCDDFTITSFAPPPVAFNLLQPAHGDTGVAYQPTFQWRAAGPPGIAYTVYVGTDSSFATADSAVSAADTSLVWGQTLNYATNYVWRVRATDGTSSLFNSLGWHRFLTTLIAAVELSSFEARGDVGQVVLEWTTAREENHLGFHVWRAEEADGDYVRLTPADRPLAGRSPYSYSDRTAAPGRTYYYRLEALDRAGGRELFGPRSAVALAVPLRLALHQNVPNPFNPSTAIRFDLPARERVRLTIYDIAGHVVRELVASEVMEPGVHAVAWNGRTSAGIEAGSGIYFARLTVADWSGTRKLLLVK